MTFTTPTPEIDRDRYGRPLVTPPDGGKPKAYTRATTLAGAIEDTYNLSRWQQRMVATGLADRPDLLLAVTAHRDDKKELNRLCSSAIEAAKGSAGATTGTALHALSEIVDTGGELPVLPDTAKADLDAYRAATVPFKMLAIEQFVVLDDIKVAGTADRIVEYDGRRYIADLKGLSLDTPIPTPNGWTTMGEVQVGDTVFDAAGKRCHVTAKSPPKSIGTYVVTFGDGSRIVCDTEHIWWTASGYRRDIAPTPKPVDEVIATLTYQGQKTHRVPVAGALELDDVELPIDPYLLGCWLGDGHARDGVITKADDLFAILAADGHDLGVRQRERPGREHIATRTVLGLKPKLGDLGLLHDKHVPDAYLRAGHDQRLRLLQGLMDTDGTWNTARRRAVFTSTSKSLAFAVEELLLTLGQQPHLVEFIGRGFGVEVTAWNVEFTPVDLNPFRLPRKADQAAASTKSVTHARRRVITSIEPGPDVLTACIGVDSPTATYLCGREMIPTHNTGSTVDFSMGSIAQQLAIYSRGLAYDPATGRRTPLDVDQQQAIVIHLPAGRAECHLHWVNIAHGWEAAQLSLRVRAYRNHARNGLAQPFAPAQRGVA